MERSPARLGAGGWIVVSVLLAILVLAAAASFWLWQGMGGTEIGLHGLIALGLGAALTTILWVGLMLLVFLSNRRGYDDRADHH
jgi:hypothetical protein